MERREVPNQNAPSAQAGFSRTYAETNPPWDIGKPQPPFVAVADQIVSPVLDVGCGTGGTSVFFAARGAEVTGVDFVEDAIRRARVRADERGVDVEFLVQDVMTLRDWNRRFASVIDSGLFHIYAGDERRRYVQGLAHVLKPGGLAVSESFQSYDPLREPAMRPSPFQAFVRIMIGCDKFCTYCVVPMTRGPEQSRPPGDIAAEVRVLAEQGVKEVTLLGQTVNSYKFTENGRLVRLSDLLARLHDTPGIDRIKFVTNYPRDMTDDLLFAVRDLPKVGRYLHVPAQSGSNDVLRVMKRGYTVEQYLEMHDRIREVMPDCAVSSDFIVGHPGESETEFEKSIDLVRRCRFKNSFIFKYSPRPGTKAFDNCPDDIPEDVKRRRNNLLLDIQNEISEEDNAAFIGREVEVLAEGPSKASRKAEEQAPANGPIQLVGRTPCDRIVVFDGNPRLAGTLARIAVFDCTPTTLIGELIIRQSHAGPASLLTILT